MPIGHASPLPAHRRVLRIPEPDDDLEVAFYHEHRRGAKVGVVKPVLEAASGPSFQHGY